MNKFSVYPRIALAAAILFLLAGIDTAQAQLVRPGSAPGTFRTQPQEPSSTGNYPRLGSASSQDILLYSRNNNISASQAVKFGDKAREGYPARYDAAKFWYQKALEKNPKEVRAYLGLGQVYNDLMNHEEAVASYRQALELKPESVEAHIGLGYSLSNQMKFAEAMEIFQKALAIKPNSVEAHLAIADCYFAQKLYTEAVAAYRKTIELKPKSLEANYSLGVTYLMLRNREAAVAQYNILKPIHKVVASKLERLINLMPASDK
ncbi:MAG: tetratricopeptide repeat protein [Pyrinomonadaceae bacterium]|nr:tetratricopeptide repeat protein [Pyrinomonadaceae bacterium]